MQLPNGDPTPIPAPDWIDAVVAPLDHGGLAVQGFDVGPAIVMFFGFLVIIIAAAFALRVLLPKKPFHNAKTRWAALTAAGLVAVVGASGVFAAGVWRADAGSANTKSAAAWAQNRYEVKITPALAGRLLDSEPIAIEALGVRAEVHLSPAADGKYYLFDASGIELPTTFDPNAGGFQPSPFGPNTGVVQPPPPPPDAGGEPPTVVYPGDPGAPGAPSPDASTDTGGE